MLFPPLIRILMEKCKHPNPLNVSGKILMVSQNPVGDVSTFVTLSPNDTIPCSVLCWLFLHSFTTELFGKLIVTFPRVGQLVLLSTFSFFQTPIG